MQRVTRSIDTARRSYNALSRWYDLLAGASEGPFREKGLVLLDAQPGERVLELGFGTGHALVNLATSVGETGSVVGLDISDGMVRAARQRLVDTGTRHRVMLLLADGARPCFASRTFDAIFMSFTLELFDTPVIPSVLRRCRDLLRPDGRLSIVSLVRENRRNGLPVRIYECAHRAMPRWVDCRPIPLQRLLTDNGFDLDAAMRRHMWGLPVEMVLARPRP